MGIQEIHSMGSTNSKVPKSGPTFTVTIPEGATPGSTLHVHLTTPVSATVPVVVPANATPGMTITIWPGNCGQRVYHDQEDKTITVSGATITGADGCTISGDFNYIEDCENCTIIGSFNIIKDAYKVEIAGSANVVKDVGRCTIKGSHNLFNDVEGCTVMGIHNRFKCAEACTVTGGANEFLDGIGDNNLVKEENSMLIGQGNIVEGWSICNSAYKPQSGHQTDNGMVVVNAVSIAVGPTMMPIEAN